MDDELLHRGSDLSGSLHAWKRRGSQSGVVMTLQILDASDQARRCHRVKLAMDDRQLRSIVHDLIQAAHERDIPVRTRRTFGARLRRLIRAIIN